MIRRLGRQHNRAFIREDRSYFSQLCYGPPVPLSLSPPARVHVRRKLQSLCLNMCSIGDDRREPDDSQRCWSLPLSEAPPGPTMTLFFSQDKNLIPLTPHSPPVPIPTSFGTAVSVLYVYIHMYVFLTTLYSST